LSDEAGRQLRIRSNADGTCEAALFSPGATVGESIGRCGVLTMIAQHSRVKSVTNLRGTATLQCETGQHEVVGRVEFENCH